MPRKSVSVPELVATAVHLTKAHQCDSRAFDDCFEMGNGTAVVAGFVKVYARDRALQKAVLHNDAYINISQWQQTAARAAEQAAPPLFA